MTFSQEPNMDTNNDLDFVVKVPPPNDNTDGQDCPCGHADAAHQRTERSTQTEPTWQCLYCTCTRPARVPSNS